MIIPDLPDIVSVVFFLAVAWICVYAFLMTFVTIFGLLTGGWSYVKQVFAKDLQLGVQYTNYILIGSFFMVLFFAYIPFVITRGM